MTNEVKIPILQNPKRYTLPLRKMNKLSLREKVNHLPHKPGVYCFKDKNNKYLYIGKAKSLKNRVRSYFHNASPFDPKTAVMVSKIHDFETIVTDSEVEALILEANLVRKNKPKYNINQIGRASCRERV